MKKWIEYPKCECGHEYFYHVPECYYSEPVEEGSWDFRRCKCKKYEKVKENGKKIVEWEDLKEEQLEGEYGEYGDWYEFDE